MKTTAICLAAGKGTRMKSALPKVLHKVGGRTMLEQVLGEVRASGVQDCCIVVGHGAEQVQAALGDGYTFALQQPQLGTGHCVQCAMPSVAADSDAVLIVCGDTPLLTAATLTALRDKFAASGAAGIVLTAVMPDPTGYGRIIRDDAGNVCAIVEEKDAAAEQKAVREINTGAYIFAYGELCDAIGRLDNNNAQHEYYLTDVIRLLAAKGCLVDTLVVDDPVETMGVNDRVQLAEAAAELRRRKNRELMLSGVTIIDPASCYIEQDVQVGQDTVIYPHCQLRGNTVIGAGCVLDGECILTDTVVGDDSRLTKVVADKAVIGQRANIGPFAYLRPGTRLADDVKVGDFAEIKNARIGKGSKIPHLSYVGDAEVGEHVNIGCGTITCNYDGVNKHLTKIGNNVFIGSNTNLVAPVEVADDAFVGAGSTITRPVEAGALAVERGKRRDIARWNLEQSPKARQKKD